MYGCRNGHSITEHTRTEHTHDQSRRAPRTGKPGNTGSAGSRSYYYDVEEQASLLGEASASAAASLRDRVGLAAKPPPPTPPPRSWWHGCLPELSYSTRLGGFAFCFLLGTLFSLISLTSFSSVLLGNPGPFAFKYTVGNVLSICSYCFLVGPAKQCAGMFAPERRLLTLCYLLSFGATLFCTFYLKNWLCTTLALAAQSVAMLLYALSYLPAGMGLGLVRRLLGC